MNDDEVGVYAAYSVLPYLSPPPKPTQRIQRDTAALLFRKEVTRIFFSDQVPKKKQRDKAETRGQH